jgi:hypothetical protein
VEQLLLKGRANINAQANNGATVWSLASMHQKRGVREVLNRFANDIVGQNIHIEDKGEAHVKKYEPSMFSYGKHEVKFKDTDHSELIALIGTGPQYKAFYLMNPQPQRSGRKKRMGFSMKNKRKGGASHSRKLHMYNRKCNEEKQHTMKNKRKALHPRKKHLYSLKCRTPYSLPQPGYGATI